MKRVLRPKPTTPALLACGTLAAALAACAGEEGPYGEVRAGLVEVRPDGTLFLESEVPEEARALAEVRPGVPDLDHRLGTVPDRPLHHDFGVVPRGERISTSFRLANTDPVPVTVRKIQPSCGCTLANVRVVDAGGAAVAPPDALDGEALVPPGGILELGLSIDTDRVTDVNTPKLYSVRVETDSRSRAYLTLELGLFVDQPLQASPPYLDLGHITAEAGGRGRIEIARAGSGGVRPVGIASAPPALAAELDHATPGGEDLWTLEVEVLPQSEPGRATWPIVLATETDAGEPAEPFRVNVTAFLQRGIQVQGGRLILRPRDAEGGLSGATTLVSAIPGHRIEVVGVRVLGGAADRLVPSVEPLEPDEEGRSSRWRVELELDPAIDAEARASLLARPFDGEVVLATDDSQFPEIRFPYVAFVH